MQENNQTVGLDLTSLITMSKSDMNATISDKMEVVNDGWIDAVDLFIYAKKLEYIAGELVKAVKDKVDAGKFGPTGYTRFGVELVGRSSGVSWDFTNCNYAPLEQAVSVVKEQTELVKKHQEFLKSLTAPMTLLDDDTGEVTTILPPPPKTGKLGPVSSIK